MRKRVVPFTTALLLLVMVGCSSSDPTASGSEQEVLDLLDEMATPDVASGDLAFGGVMTGIWRQGWRNTLFGGMDVTIEGASSRCPR